MEKLLFIESLRPRDRVQTTLIIRSRELQSSRDGKPYLSMVLGDKTGEVEARLWADAEDWFGKLLDGMFLMVSGKVNTYQNRLQLTIEHLAPLDPSEVKLEDFLAASPVSLEPLYTELVAIFSRVGNPWVRKLSLSLLTDPEISDRYKRCPAAKTIHHAFLGGLLCHSMQLIRLVDAVVPNYEDVDRDILLFGAAFHDFGKVFELAFDRSIEYTDEGKLVGHIAIGVTLLDQHMSRIPDFPKALGFHLKHLILSHHGKLDFGSPKVPQTVEAEVLHLLDTLDSRIQSIQHFMKADKSPSRWTGFHKTYQRSYYKPDSLLRRSSSGPVPIQ